MSERLHTQAYCRQVMSTDGAGIGNPATWHACRKKMGQTQDTRKRSINVALKTTSTVDTSFAYATARSAHCKHLAITWSWTEFLTQSCNDLIRNSDTSCRSRAAIVRNVVEAPCTGMEVPTHLNSLCTCGSLFQPSDCAKCLKQTCTRTFAWIFYKVYRCLRGTTLCKIYGAR